MCGRECKASRSEDVNALDLPHEVWQRIASCVSLPEWAKAAGACRYLWKMYLNRVYVNASSSTTANYQGVASPGSCVSLGCCVGGIPNFSVKVSQSLEMERCVYSQQQAHQSCVSCCRERACFPSLCRPLVRFYSFLWASAGVHVIRFAAKRWRSAVHVNLHLSEAASRLKDEVHEMMQHDDLQNLQRLNVWTEGDSHTAAMGLVWLITHAGKLTWLSLTAAELPYLPQSSSLRHVELCVYEKCGDSLFFSLALLPCLETLELKCPDHTDALNLQGCTRLRCLSLVHTVPNNLQIPPSCQLHVQLHDLAAAQAEVWQSPDVRISSFNLIHHQCNIEDAVAVLGSLQLAQLREVTLQVVNIGAKSEPYSLNGILGRIPSLKLVAFVDLYVTIPKECAWERLSLHAMLCLSVHIADMSAFVQRLPIFSAVCEYSQMFPLSFLEIAQEIQKTGGRAIWGCTSKPPKFFARMANAKSHQEYDECWCGACCECVGGCHNEEM